jgi:hypothetical protein
MQVTAISKPWVFIKLNTEGYQFHWTPLVTVCEGLNISPTLVDP